MKALVYQGDGKCGLEDRPIPKIQEPSDAIVKRTLRQVKGSSQLTILAVVYTTICGTDTHILHGDVPTCKPGRVLGHEGLTLPKA